MCLQRENRFRPDGGGFMPLLAQGSLHCDAANGFGLLSDRILPGFVAVILDLITGGCEVF